MNPFWQTNYCALAQWYWPQLAERGDDVAPADRNAPPTGTRPTRGARPTALFLLGFLGHEVSRVLGQPPAR